jgi:hypothetical protein
VSYDLQLFRALDGESTDTALARIEAAACSDELNPGPVVPGVEAAKRKLADSLIQHMPSLRRFAFDYQQIAQIENIDETEARRKCRHIELNQDDFGLQVMLEDETATVTRPYWHEGEEADTAFRALWQCLAVLRKEAGYFIYDPQLNVIGFSTPAPSMTALLCWRDTWQSNALPSKPFG